ncbi:ECF transporter S component [Ignavigranum ruoffiae]|uniref:ECF transporter S component n=1 Tax=Ignavigranum ruoffiae TaxID=89093 RepID=UPI00205D62C5|nr:ECF transporter S component [Ignavigranum ruoffiae]UPQ85598.1 ECF transporter S component [Ignavigranum ruoffiae]
MKKLTVRNMVLLAILGAWAIVLRMIEIPLLPSAPFLKMDFSDFAVLIATLVHGPLGLIVVACLRDLVWYMVTGGDLGLPIGEFMSITASLAMFLPTYFILKGYDRRPENLSRIYMSATLIIALVSVMSVINYYVALPFYTKIMGLPIENFGEYIWAIIIPFNLIKGVIYALGQVLVIRIMKPILEKKQVYFLTKWVHPSK